MKCPGQDSRYWKPGSIFETQCPGCGVMVEFFKDDPTRKCHACGHKFVNPNMDFGCAAYCRFADQCIGELPPELLAERQELMKDRIAVEMKKYYKTDFKRIGNATRVARHAETLSRELGGDMAVVLAASYLHEIGVNAAKQKHGSTDRKYVEMEGPGIAREIMEKAGARNEMTEAVCDIISGRCIPETDEGINCRIVSDALELAAMEVEYKDGVAEPEQAAKRIQNRLSTQSARDRAKKLFLQ